MTGQSGKQSTAGRRSRGERFATKIVRAEKRIADRLPELIDHLFLLAEGGTERVRERWEPAGMVLIDGFLRDAEGEVLTDNAGRPLRGKVPAFPGRAPEELVLVERVTESPTPDRLANTYLLDRILGKPTQQVEADITTGGQPLSAYLTDGLAKVYGNGDAAPGATDEEGA